MMINCVRKMVRTTTEYGENEGAGGHRRADPSDDSGRLPEVSRRGVLSLTAAALAGGLAGCTCSRTGDGGMACEFDPDGAESGSDVDDPGTEPPERADGSAETSPETSGDAAGGESSDGQVAGAEQGEEGVITERPVGPKDSGNVGNANNSTAPTGG
jgi:hypothetical protein